MDLPSTHFNSYLSHMEIIAHNTSFLSLDLQNDIWRIDIYERNYIHRIQEKCKPACKEISRNRLNAFLSGNFAYGTNMTGNLWRQNIRLQYKIPLHPRLLNTPSQTPTIIEYFPISVL